MHLTTEILEKIAELVATAASWRQICTAVGIKSESTLWNWRARCIADQRNDDLSSPFLITFRGERMWWTAACDRSRRESLILGESIIKQQAISGIPEVVRDSSQNILYQKNPHYIGRPDSFVMFSEGCTEEEVAWHRLLHDDNGLPRPEVVVRQVPAALRLRLLEASSSDYRPTSHQTIDVQSNVHVVHETKAIERPKGERVDIAEIRALAALPASERRARIGGTKYPRDANGHPMLTAALVPPSSHSDAPDDQHRGVRPAPPPYVPPQQPQQPRPSYAKISRSLDDIRGDPPEGGAPANGPGMVR